MRLLFLAINAALVSAKLGSKQQQQPQQQPQRDLLVGVIGNCIVDCGNENCEDGECACDVTDLAPPLACPCTGSFTCVPDPETICSTHPNVRHEEFTCIPSGALATDACADLSVFVVSSVNIECDASAGGALVCEGDCSVQS